MLYLFFYILEITILAVIEKRNWGSYITPLNCLSIPCGIVTLLAIIFPYFTDDFPKFYLPALSVWIIGIGVFALPSVCLARASKKMPLYLTSPLNSSRKNKIYKFLLSIAIICLCFTFFKMKSVAGSSSWGSDEFSESYSSGSLVGHLSVIISVIFSYMLFIADSKHKMAYLITGLSLISMYAVGVKSWIIAPILIGFLARLLSHKTKPSFKFIIGISLICISIFVLSYVLLMVVTGKSQLDNSFINFLINHFMFYLIGSPLSFSIDYQLGIIEPNLFKALFAPPINMYRLFSGDDFVVQINPIGIPIAHGYSNVRTFIGTIFAYSHSWCGVIIVSLLFSIYTNFVHVISQHSRNIFLLLADCSNMAFLILGFFEFYWLNLGAYEIFVLFILFGFVYKYLPIKCKHAKSV